MRRTARALSATALTAVVLGTIAAAAAANPTAEVSPRTVAPGGTVTVSVSCEPTGGPAPETIDAASQAFEHGTVQLHKAAGKDDSAEGPAYSGTARIAPAENFEEGAPDAVGKTSDWGVDGTCPAAPGGQGKEWSASFTVSREGSKDGSSKDGSKDGSKDSPIDGSKDAFRGSGVQHGVRAGEGGSFTDSPVALGAGGVLIAGALGAAVHRLRRREPSSKG
jgi:hypothetical protein